jgi:hypothetical protein
MDGADGQNRIHCLPFHAELLKIGSKSVDSLIPDVQVNQCFILRTLFLLL